MRSNQQNGSNRPPMLWSALILSTLIIIFGQPQSTHAQWSNPDASGNINNTNSGNVGIGTSAPDTALHVSSGSLSAYPKVYGSQTTWTSAIFSNNYDATLRLRHSSAVSTFYTDASTQAINFSTNGYSNSRLFISGGGNVGMGTTSPIGRLDVRQIGNSGSLATFLTSYGANEDTYLRGGSSSAVVHIGDVSTTTSKLLLMENGGNVGIGTTNPQAALDVNGSINVSGNINAKYQDVAEWVQSAHQMLAGTVVILDPTHSNQVTASNQSYDTRVAGVVSERPGIALGEAGVNKVLVATTGRVRVRVDATRAPIHVGDLLVTSDVEGVAMRSEPVSIGGVQIHRPGTLIGKALEPLERGTGEILVLLSLQ